ncbi:MAG: endonuclease/exonuclease/phosphatase family protein [Myxococcota bacterium]
MDQLRVATLNLWNKSGPWIKRMARIRAELGAEDFDIVGLQEVLELENDSGTKNQAGEIAEGRHWCFGLGHNMKGKWVPKGSRLGFGNAVLSRFPIASSEVVPLPGADQSDQKRSLLHACVQAPFGDLDVFVTHLNWRLDEGHIREQQVCAVVDAIEARARAGYPALLMGDFNADPQANEIRYLRGLCTLGRPRSVRFADAWEYAPDAGLGFTFDGRANQYASTYHEPPRRLDYLFVRGGPDAQGRGYPDRVRLAFHEPVDGVWCSDHFGVAADLRVGPVRS